MSAVGLQAGDIIDFYSTVDIISATNILEIEELILFNDSLSISTRIKHIPNAKSFKKFKSCKTKIPVGATTMTYYLWIKVGSSSSASIVLSDLEVKKVV